jgi:hypothetical protein
MFLNDDKARGWNRSPKEIEDVVQAAIPALMRGAEAESRWPADTLDLTDFRASWKNGDVTTHRKHERMVSFFPFCVRNEFLRKNPMGAPKNRNPDIVPTDYFRPIEFEAVLGATERYDIGGGNHCRDRGNASHALVWPLDSRCDRARPRSVIEEPTWRRSDLPLTG